ncbi:branched-chain amino acid transport system permease protein [Variovorax sp. OK212]|nr:branched-chain amino acid transport system permease protein [Variovorax sp. OK202]SFD86688.1 branched-chain amino acid transport system permease protein [Variovorax sp. OK212]
MFFGSAGYTAGYAMKAWGVTPEIGLLLGTLAAALAGLLVGSLAIRRQGIYFAMITLALSQMVYFVLLQAPFTGGEDGLQGVPRGSFLGIFDLSSDIAMYYFVALVFVLGFVAIWRIVNSPFGHILKAIRENEPRAVSLGYDANRFKLLAFVLSSALAGLAGSLKVLVLGVETLTDVHWHTSGEVVLMTLMGGVGTLLGPVIGATAVVGIQSELADKVGSWVTVIMGVIFVICVLSFRKGIVGGLLAVLTPGQKRKPANPKVASTPNT